MIFVIDVIDVEAKGLLVTEVMFQIDIDQCISRAIGLANA